MANQSKSPGGVGRVSAPARNPTLVSAALGTGGGEAGNGHSGGGKGGKPEPPRDAAGSIFTAQLPAGAGRTVSAVLGEIVWL